jgi:iron complex outermembrane receptor protein
MENIDKVFVTKLEDNGTEEVVPGLSEYRDAHQTGDAVFDLQLGYHVTKIVKASFIVKNALNREYMTRPADIQPPRSFTIQLAAAF